MECKEGWEGEDGEGNTKRGIHVHPCPCQEGVYGLKQKATTNLPPEGPSKAQ